MNVQPRRLDPRHLLCWMFLALLSGLAPAEDNPPKPIFAPIQFDVRFAPTAFRGDGKSQLAYELAIVNLGKTPCTLDKIVVNSESGEQLGSFEAKSLSDALLRVADPAEKKGEERQKLRPGELTIFYGWLSFPGKVPASLVHQLSVRVGDYPEPFVLEGGHTPVLTKIRTIQSPLRGENWMAANGPANFSGHRRVIIPLDGLGRIPQRFATDWLQIDADGKSSKGDEKDNKNYHCYGKEAFAVADATVVATKEGIPENVPGATSRAVPITLETVAGNHVVLDLGDGVYAFYAHLQPGSLRVKLGDKVHAGQVVGLVGNSGNSTEPHLHFHLIDRNSALGGEGLPFLLPAFQVQGVVPFSDDDNAVKVEWKPWAQAQDRQNETPLGNQVIRFAMGK